MKERFIITGMSRSGTTLVEKLLASHSDIGVLSQPFPLLYRYLKEVFYHQIRYPETYYVLNNMFCEKKYSIDQLTAFLFRQKIDREEVVKVLQDMKGWNGQWEHFEDPKNLIEGYENGQLDELYKTLLENAFHGVEYGNVGSKEVMVEEFIPYFLSKGIKVLLVVRDPRDVISSINMGNGPSYAGEHRPTLFHLRNWRKSIAIMNSYAEDDLFFSVKYEDLISDHHQTLSLITDFLQTDPFPQNYFSNGIKTKSGDVWHGNSSTDHFEGIDASNMEKFKDMLEPAAIKYIEFMCKPEMEVLGYKLLYERDLKQFEPSSFREPFEVRVSDLSSSYSSDETEISLEKKRLSLLDSKSPDQEIANFFITSSNYQILKKSEALW